MSGNRSVPLSALSELLRESSLLAVEIDANHSSASIAFDGLRRDDSGQALRDRQVRLQLRGVCAVAVTCDVTFPNQRPSSLVVPQDGLIGNLTNWSTEPIETEVALDSHTSNEALRLAARVTWIHGA